MLERLDWIREVPEAWVHWAPLSGGMAAHRRLCERYPQAQAWLAGAGATTALERLRQQQPSGWAAWAQRWKGGRERAARLWPVVPTTPMLQADMVWANMALHLSPDPAQLLAGWRDMLRVDGYLMFSALGPDTLHELRDLHQAQGWPAPMHPLTDMHDWGDMLVELGWAEPVVDMERLTLTYPDAARLLADLRGWGRNFASQRFPALRGRGYRRDWLAAVEQHLPRDSEGRLVLTFEVVYGHVLRARPRLSGAVEQQVTLQDMRAMLRRSPKPPDVP